jgi:hypothetical protein
MRHSLATVRNIQCSDTDGPVEAWTGFSLKRTRGPALGTTADDPFAGESAWKSTEMAVTMRLRIAD